MINFFSYLRAQFLRALKLYPVIIAFTLILSISISIFLVNMISSNEEGESKQKIEIGLVGNVTDTYLGIGVEAVQNFDTSKFYLEFVNLDEDEAVKRLESGRIMGYITIPEGFIDSIVSGENKKLSYVVGNSPASIGPVIMNDIVEVISDIVTESQSSIYGFIDIAKETELKKKARNKLVDKLNLEYIDIILDRESAYKTSFIGISSGLSFKDYYVCAFILLILLLCGTVCAHLLVKTNLSLPRLLYCSGQPLWKQLLGDYLPFITVIFIDCIAMLFSANAVLGSSQISILEGGYTELLLFALKILPAIVLITAMQFLIYEISRNIISGVLLQVILTLVLAYVSGFFYPLYSLPKLLQTVSRLLPTGIAFEYVTAVFKEESTPLLLAATLLYGIALLIAAGALRYYKLRRSENA